MLAAAVVVCEVAGMLGYLECKRLSSSIPYRRSPESPGCLSVGPSRAFVFDEATAVGLGIG